MLGILVSSFLLGFAPYFQGPFVVVSFRVWKNHQMQPPVRQRKLAELRRGNPLEQWYPKNLPKRLIDAAVGITTPLSLTWFILKNDTKRNSSSRFRTWKVHHFQVSAVKLWECSCVVFGGLMLMVFEHGSAAKNAI